MKYGEAGSLLNYFHNKVVENPSFQYALQLDSEEQITNIFWVDAKMLIDYAHFGDVVTFDTTFGTNQDIRPFGVFVGFNHFRETVIFGVALMYDESVDSFKWLFETFLSTHNQKKPRTIYTDQDVAMGKAITDVLPETWHGLCTWHIMQNAIKHLNCHMVEGSNVLGDFSACMYEYEDIVKFEDVFSKMRAKVHKQTWLDSIYKVKEKWAECYMKDVYTLCMRSTQLSESLNSDMKEYLNSELNILRFFSHFERAVQAKRDKEITLEYDSREKLPRIQMRTPMLLQASNIYTPQIFEAFQSEYERFMAAYTRPSSEGNAYIVGIGVLDEESTLEEEHVLPEHYIMKRWTTIHDAFGRNVLVDPKGAMVTRVAQPQTIVEKCFRTDQDQIEGSEFIGSYTQLLMGHSGGHKLNSEGLFGTAWTMDDYTV
ncbi:protein FAR1-RELATED SEQUENCE 5-like [Phragmites australis]|uniref:protein FAR1-RELATED SEQUENCE 5-like n=1 Tax=Phragmites australis TaxID=29695 RepID=UPI002D78541D|nr:protein FAR1-RELATED SEQUENCE 5-like [Phragmites australis]